MMTTGLVECRWALPGMTTGGSLWKLDLPWPIGAMRRGPARVAVEAVVEAVAVVEEAVTMSVVTATAITGPT